MRCVASRRTLLIGMVRGGSVLAAADRLRHCRGDVEGAERGRKEPRLQCVTVISVGTVRSMTVCNGTVGRTGTVRLRFSNIQVEFSHHSRSAGAARSPMRFFRHRRVAFEFALRCVVRLFISGVRSVRPSGGDFVAAAITLRTHTAYLRMKPHIGAHARARCMDGAVSSRTITRPSSRRQGQWPGNRQA